MSPILYVLYLPGGTVVPIHTYGVMRGIAIAAAILLARWAFKRRGIDPDHVYWAAIWITPVALIGATLSGVGQAVAATVHQGTPLLEGVVSAMGSGGTYLLALPLAGLAFAIYSRRYGLPVLPSLDIMGLCVAAVMPLQRLGCFAAGCCYGKPTDLPWAVVYASTYPLYPAVAPLGVPIHPTQIYEAVAVAALFGVLVRRFTAANRPGEILFGFLVGYGAIRFAVEFVRDDVRSFVWEGLVSFPQLTSLIAIAGGLLGLRLLSLDRN